MFGRAMLWLSLALVLGGCSRAPRPTSELGREIYRLMLKYEAVVGPTYLNDELCGLLDDRSLSVAVEELPELNATSNLVTVRTTTWPPEGSTAASFSRPVEWFFRTQTLHIFINTDAKFCNAFVRIRST